MPSIFAQFLIPNIRELSVVFLSQATVAVSVHLELSLGTESPRVPSVSPELQIYSYFLHYAAITLSSPENQGQLNQSVQ